MPKSGTLCENILDRAMALDMNASISSVARRDADDSTLVRIRTSKDTALGVLAALRVAWPLATVTLVQNRLSGKTEAQVLLPNEKDQQEIAKTLANYGTGQKALRLIANLLLVALAISCTLRIVQ
tara:strand:+ start:406 stop:780 length:375 start_codon:yes stop_codon:yes gene_type:complete